MEDGDSDQGCPEQPASDPQDDAVDAVCDAAEAGIHVFVLGLDFTKKSEHLAVLRAMANCSGRPLYLWANWTQMPALLLQASGGTASSPSFIYDANCTDPDAEPVAFGDDFPGFEIDPVTGLIVWPLNGYK